MNNKHKRITIYFFKRFKYYITYIFQQKFHFNEKAYMNLFFLMLHFFCWTDNGYKNVHFHVVANIGCYRTENITKVRETVAAIVGCTIEEVLVNGYLHSTSFILVLSIKNNFVHKLLAFKRKDKDTLSKLSIDYFKIDSTIIRLKGLRGIYV